MTITEEAIDAAREQLEAMGAYVARDYVEAALEAAAPYLIERAYNAGHLDGMTGAPNQNPYRSAK